MEKKWTEQEIRQLSNVCYNRGLDKAQVRDMAGAVYELKRCLQLNKNHIEARNLLGLVYYETGEMADALAEWVISTNYKSRNNPAIAYIGRLQDRQEFLNEMILASRKYNQALHLLHENSEDLAILQLNKVLSLNPHFVRAYQLLALVHIKHHQYAKAEKALRKASNIDRTNTVTMRYLNELKRIANARRKKNLEDLTNESENEFEELSADDVIIPTYRGDILGGWATVVNLMVGIGIGLACFYFMLLPTQISNLSASYNRQLIQITEEHDVQDAQITNLQSQVDILTDQLSEAQESAAAAQESASAAESAYDNQVSSYSAFLAALAAAESDDPTVYLPAIAALQAMDVSQITDANWLTLYNAAVARIPEEASKKLLAWGEAAYTTHTYDSAISYLTQALTYDPTSVEAMYYLGVSYKESGESTLAITWLTQIIDNYPTDPFAVMAQTARGY